jgi:predicted transcriptional regulator
MDLTEYALMKRNNLDISAEILNVATCGVKKTKLVYQANLNFKLIKKYLNSLMERGFIEESKGLYYTTNEGIEFLDKYNELNFYIQ